MTEDTKQTTENAPEQDKGTTEEKGSNTTESNVSGYTVEELADDGFLKTTYPDLCDHGLKTFKDGGFTKKQAKYIIDYIKTHDNEELTKEEAIKKAVSEKFPEEDRNALKDKVIEKYGKDKGAKLWKKYQHDEDFIDYALDAIKSSKAKVLVKATVSTPSIVKQIEELKKNEAYRDGSHDQHDDVMDKIHKLEMERLMGVAGK